LRDSGFFLGGVGATILALVFNVMIYARSFGPELEPGLTILRLTQGLINATLALGAGIFAAGLGWMVVRALTKRA
jgi:hypothetical protein